MRRVFVIGIVAVVIVVGVLAVRSNGTQQATAEQDSRLQTVTVERGSVLVTVRATGQVEPAQTAQVNFDTAGVVDEIPVEEGQHVSAGQVLARLDDEVQRIGVEQAEWGVRIAELNLQKLEEPPSEGDLNAARAGVNSAWTAYVDLRDNSVNPEALRMAELQYEQALSSYDAAEQASRDARRSEMSLAQVGSASFAAEIARLQLEQLRDGPSQEALSAAQAQVAQAQAQLRLLEVGPTQAQLDQAAIAVEQARLQLARAQDRWNETVLVAPFDGVVNRVNIQRGGLVAAGMLPAIEIVDLSSMTITVEVDEIDIVQVTPGLSVEVTVDALPNQQFTGVVQRVADVATQGAGVVSYEVEIALNAAESPIRPGMTAAATVVVQEVTDVLVVPNLFIRLDRRTEMAFVNVLAADGSLVEREIELGVQNDTVSEVRSGLAEGDIIAIDLEAGGFSIFGGSE